MNSREDKYRAVVELSMRQAKDYLSKGNYARAFSHFLVILQLKPELSKDVQEDFIYALCELGLSLEAKQNYSSLFKCYEQALDTLPNCCELQNNFGAHLLRLGHTEEATIYFLQSINLNPDYVPARANLDNASNTLIERWHFPMLNDARRNVAFRNAIFKAVKNGCSSVLDIGSGTGILSLFAIEAGAKEVFACEMSKIMYSISRNVLKRNKVEDKIKLFNLHSTKLSIPEHLPNKVHLMITETVDCGLFGEGILQTVTHAWKNLLHSPSHQISASSTPGKVIPNGATVWACLIESKSVRYQNRTLFPNIGPLNLDSLHNLPISDENPYLAENIRKLQEEVKYICEPIAILSVNFNDVQELESYQNGFEKQVVITTTSSGIVDATVVWFDLHLDEEISISTASNTCWDQAFFPTDPTSVLNVAKDSHVNLEVKIIGNCLQIKCLNSSERTENNTVTTKHSFNTVHVSRCEISKINNQHYWNTLMKCLSSSKTNKYNLLDTDEFPIAALLALKCGASNVGITSNCNYGLLKVLAETNNIDMCNIKRISKAIQESRKWDVILFDVLESNGLLKEKIFEEISVLRHLALKPLGCIMPYAVSVKVYLIESETLLHMNRMFDSKTNGCFNIADSVNIFKVSFHCDITLSTLPHRQLTEAIEVLYIPIQEGSTCNNISNVKELCSIENGVIHGIFIWYTVHLTKDISFETTAADSRWKQYCIVLHDPLPVSQWQKLKLKTKCENSWITITIC